LKSLEEKEIDYLKRKGTELEDRKNQLEQELSLVGKNWLFLRNTEVIL